MNNLIQLIKVDLRETLDIRKFKENKSKSIPFLVFILLMGSLFLFISIIYNLIFSAMFYDTSANLIYSTIMMCSIASLLCFFTSVFKVKGIFTGKDYDMLRSMPIRKRDIIFSKIFNLYIIELIYSIIILLPNIVINILFTQNFMYIPIGLVAMLLIPAFPMMMSCLFSLFISLIADRFKFGNVINFILYVLLFVCIMLFSFMMNISETDEEFVKTMINLTDNIMWINPLNYFLKLSFTNNYLYSLIFVFGNIIVLFGVVSFIALLFDKVHALITTIKSDVKYVRKELEVKGQLKTLLSMEFKRFFSSKVYFINCISSGICAIVISGLFAYMFSDFSYIEGIEEILPFIRKYAYVGTLIIAFGIGIMTPASCSISIEGQNFWMIKSYPIDYKKLMLAKILLSTIVLGVCSLVASIIIIVLVKPTIYSSVLLIILSLLYVLLTSIISLIMNLIYPKLKWKNEQECVKQSASIVLSMFIDWGIISILAAYLIGLSFVNIYLAGLLSLGLFVLACFLFYKLLMKICIKKINNIEEF